MVLHKDFAALARIDEMRQAEMERQACMASRDRKPRPALRDGLTRQITFQYNFEPLRLPFPK